MSTRITLVSWNVLATAYIRPEYYPRTESAFLDPVWRVPNLAQCATTLEADVLCLQEVEMATFEALQARLVPNGYSGVYAERGGTRPDGCAIFLRTEVCQLESHERIVYDQPHAGAAASGHIAQLVRLNAGGLPVTLLNTHLRWDEPATHRSKQHGYRQAAFALQIFDREPSRAEVICGDFNAPPESDLVQLLLNAGFEDPYASLPAETFTFNGNSEARRIDYILLRGQVETEAMPVSAIAPDTPLPSLDYPSDHLPVRVRILRP